MSRRRLWGRHRGAWVASGALAAGWTLAAAAPALAGVTGPCDGQVTIDGVTYTTANDTADAPIVVPADAETAAWEGRTDGPITDYTGELRVVVGPGSVRIADWAGENADLQTSDEGDYAIDEARDQLPVDLVGLYEVTGSHAGEGGTCDGSVMVRVEGSPLTTPLGAGAAAVGLLSLVGLAAAGAGGAAGAAGATSTAGGTAGSSAGTTTEVP